MSRRPVWVAHETRNVRPSLSPYPGGTGVHLSPNPLLHLWSQQVCALSHHPLAGKMQACPKTAQPQPARKECSTTPKVAVSSGVSHASTTCATREPAERSPSGDRHWCACTRPTIPTNILSGTVAVETWKLLVPKKVWRRLSRGVSRNTYYANQKFSRYSIFCREPFFLSTSRFWHFRFSLSAH